MSIKIERYYQARPESVVEAAEAKAHRTATHPRKFVIDGTRSRQTEALRSSN